MKTYLSANKISDRYLTRPEMIQAIGKFDLDPCCPPEWQYKTAEAIYSLEKNENGLVLPWFGRVWLNPPPSNWVPFVEKLQKHGNGIALLPVKTETAGFFEHVWGIASAMLFLRGRVDLLKPDGITVVPASGPSVLVAYGDECADLLERTRIPGFFVDDLTNPRNWL